MHRVRPGGEQGRGPPMGKFLGVGGLVNFRVLSSKIVGIQSLGGVFRFILMILVW